VVCHRRGGEVIIARDRSRIIRSSFPEIHRKKEKSTSKTSPKATSKATSKATPKHHKKPGEPLHGGHAYTQVKGENDEESFERSPKKERPERRKKVLKEAADT
jgi:hypothetical protein